MCCLINSWLPGMLDALFQATFLCSLLMFWLCIYHGLRQNERKFFAFYLPKLIVLLPIWLCAIVLATWEKCNELNDPTYNHFIDTGNYNVSFFPPPFANCSIGWQTRWTIIVYLCVYSFAGHQSDFLYGWCNVFVLFGIVDIESIQWTQIDAIFW